MSDVVAIDPRDAEIALLKQQIAEMDAAQQLSVAKKPNPITGLASRVFHAVIATLTSPEVVAQEKSLATLVVTRLVVTLGGAYGAGTAVDRILHALGWV